jgi:phosphate/sulfate permease
LVGGSFGKPACAGAANAAKAAPIATQRTSTIRIVLSFIVSPFLVIAVSVMLQSRLDATGQAGRAAL